MMDPNATQMISEDLNKTQVTSAPSLNVTQTIQPVQCPVCKTFNPAGEAFCVECGLLFAGTLPDDAFGAPAVRLPCFVDESGREHYLRPGTNIVGREGDILLQHPQISRKHAQVNLQNDQITVEDLGSTNGTTLNGEELQPNVKHEIKTGDEIAFGGIKLILSIPGESHTTQIGVSQKTQTLSAPPQVETPKAYLVGDAKYPLNHHTNIIGRKSDADVVLTDPFVSGKHGIIEIEEDEIFYTDVGSTNGSFLNGAKMVPNEKIKIQPEDELKIGNQIFKIEQPE